jgi:hypothetical protein
LRLLLQTPPVWLRKVRRLSAPEKHDVRTVSQRIA